MKNDLSFDWEDEDEKVRRGMRISPKEKLRWLRETNEFIDRLLSDKQKEIRQKLREIK